MGALLPPAGQSTVQPRCPPQGAEAGHSVVDARRARSVRARSVRACSVRSRGAGAGLTRMATTVPRRPGGLPVTRWFPGADSQERGGPRTCVSWRTRHGGGQLRGARPCWPGRSPSRASGPGTRRRAPHRRGREPPGHLVPRCVRRPPGRRGRGPPARPHRAGVRGGRTRRRGQEARLTCGGQAEILLQPLHTVPARWWDLLSEGADAALITRIDEERTQAVSDVVTPGCHSGSAG